MNIKLIAAIGAALALGACASEPRSNAALDSARLAVGTAEADPNVATYAPLELSNARKQLDIANSASLSHHDEAIAQPAYLATQEARLAQARAAGKADDARVAAGQSERDRIQLSARAREVDNARMAAAAANNSAAIANSNAAVAASAAAVAISERDQAADQAARLQSELDQLKATPTPRGLVLTLGDVLFDTGQAELKSGADRKMDQLAAFLNDHKDRRLQIDGFTDSVGSESYNEDLSRRRANAVKDAMVSRGIDSSRISTQGYGKAYPVATNVDSGGRQLNRRVEVVIGGPDGAAVAARN